MPRWMCFLAFISFFFFFKAEDGIRYLTVTGFQTCALPICGRGDAALRTARGRRSPAVTAVRRHRRAHRSRRRPWRSEEHTSELQSQSNVVCRLLLEKKKDAPF